MTKSTTTDNKGIGGASNASPTTPLKYAPLPRSHRKCGIDCCHAMECCPRGFKERWQNFRYSRNVTDVGIIEYWKWEFECLIGMHRYKPKKGCEHCTENECYEHDYFGEYDD